MIANQLLTICVAALSIRNFNRKELGVCILDDNLNAVFHGSGVTKVLVLICL